MTAGRQNADTLHKDWGTPHKYVAASREALGGAISLDPCSNRWSVVGAETNWSLPEVDGLAEPWCYPTIYVNPPYGSDGERGTKISHWLRKCAGAFDDFGSEVVALVPVAANTKHWKDSVWSKASSVCFLYDTRLRFLENGKDVGKGAPMACATVYWGKSPDRFAMAFFRHGAVVNLKDVRIPPEWRMEDKGLFEADRRFG